MIKDVISYLNLKVEALGYFNSILCLAEKIERNGSVYPALYNNDNEYQPINLDINGSLCYWRKSGDVSFSKQENTTGIGVQYLATIPLKFIGFIKKEPVTNDTVFADNVCLALIANLTVNNSAFKPMLKAKTAAISASKYSTDHKSVAAGEYENVDFEPRYTHAYFSIDFDLTFLTTSQCYADFCGNNITDIIQLFNFCDDVVYDRLSLEQKECLTSRCAGGGGSSAGTVDVYINSVFQSSTASSDLDAETVTITI